MQFVALLLAVGALGVAPPLLWLTRLSAGLRAALDGFVLVVVAGVALLHLGPHALLHGGVVAIAGIAVGALLPVALHRAGRSGLWVASALGVLGVHALVEGAALGLMDTSLSVGVGAAVVAHRLPVGLAVVAASRGLFQAGVVLAALAGLTVLGFISGDLLWEAMPHAVHSLTEGAIVGGLLHVVFKHGLPEPEPEPEPEPMTFTPMAQSSSMVLTTPPVHDHAECGHLHDHAHHDHSHHHDHAGDPRQRRASAIGAVLGVLALTGLASVSGQSEALAHLHASVRAFVSLTVTSAPALLAGFVLAGLVSSFLDPARAGWLSGGRSGSQALRGVLFGLPLPVCSCGVVPMYRSLIQRGVPVAAGLAFLVATPELGLDAVLLSVPLLGVPLTVARVVAAFLVAFVVAVLVSGAAGSKAPPRDEPPPPDRDAKTRLREGLRYGLIDLVDHTLPWILIGLVLAALAEPLLDHELLATLPPVVQVPLAAMVGVPLYVCASGATPLAAVAVHKGLSSGAALAFLLAGPATNVTTFGILSALHGRKLALQFGLALTLAAVGMGWAVDILGVAVPEIAHPDHVDDHGLNIVGLAAAVAVGGLAVASLWRQGARGMLEQVLHPIHDH